MRKTTSSANRERTYRFPVLNGGINLRDAEIDLKDNESPEIVNLWWDDGGLTSRPGQERVTSGWGGGSYSGYHFSADAVVYAAVTFEEGVVCHVGASLYTWHGRFTELRRVSGDDSTAIPRNPGTFFRFNGTLFYKNSGGFYRLDYNAAHSILTSPLTIRRVADAAFVPTVLVDANPADGTGTTYQPVNRLTGLQRVRYVPASVPETVVLTADGLKRGFMMGVTAAQNLRGVSAVHANQTLVKPALYTVDINSGTVIFHAAPAEGTVLTFTLDMGQLAYHLPAGTVNGVAEVRIDGLLLNAGTDYAVDAGAGIVTFSHAPGASAQRVEIVYRKDDAPALLDVLDCPCAGTCGTGAHICAVLGGGTRHPDALYWCGVTESGPDISYWPSDAQNFIGDAVTAFGSQYDQMIVFQARRIGKCTMIAKNVAGYVRISLDYAAVNDSIGCDLPQSVQLIENNLTFANTSGGVYSLRSSSAARENNVQCLSGKVNGSDTRPGLLYDMRVAGTGAVCSLDDGQRYWLAVNGHIWLWDYTLSGANEPAWFYFTGLSPYALFTRSGIPYLLNASAEVVRLGRVFDDSGQGIHKVYQFPVRNFGSYDRLKEVRTLIAVLRADTPSDAVLTYETDYETRTDAVNLVSEGYDRLTERNLEIRDLSVPRHAAVFRRKPQCRHIRHFSFRLENDAPGYDLAPHSAELCFRYEGRDR